MAAARREGLVMLINPQWQQGQVWTTTVLPKHIDLAALLSAQHTSLSSSVMRGH